MPKLIEKLKQDHVIISDLFYKVIVAGISSNEGKKTLLDGKSQLLAHIKTENEELYPRLLAQAEKDPELKEKLETLAVEMLSVGNALTSFFERHSENEQNESDLSGDFSDIYLALTERIDNEERILFPEYKKLN